MSLQDFLSTLDGLEEEASAAFETACDADTLEAARVQFLGQKSGALRDVQKRMGSIDKADRKTAGMRLNQFKSNVQEALENAKTRLGGDDATGADPTFDPSLPGRRPSIGHIHPVTQTMTHLMEIMGRMGFEAAEGPEVEDPWHNFVALNIPEDHPARDPLDNFYLATAATGTNDRNVEGSQLLRSQTSTVQIRVMEDKQPPIRVISLGRVYLPCPCRHALSDVPSNGRPARRQNVTMANLKTVLRVFVDYLGDDVEIRFRPSFFPFTEPSVEVDFFWNGSWVEFGGAGMVDPAVFEAVGYDPEVYSGFAFGLGVERLCMRRHGITDIRDLYSGDLRFLQQF